MPQNWKLVEKRRFVCADILQVCAYKLGFAPRRPVTDQTQIAEYLRRLEEKGFLFVIEERRERRQ